MLVAGGRVNDNCRNIAVTICAYVRPIAPRAAEAMEEALVSYPPALRRLCQSDPDATQLPVTATYKMHEALAAAAKEAEARSQAPLGRMEALQLNLVADRVSSLCDCAGGCSRLVSTPLPKSYSRHTSRFLTIWCGRVLRSMCRLAVPTSCACMCGYRGDDEADDSGVLTISSW